MARRRKDENERMTYDEYIAQQQQAMEEEQSEESCFLAAQTEKDMQHLTLHTQEHPEASNEWLEPVSDEQYNQVK